MRQPYETLIFPYKKDLDGLKYAIFLRNDMKVWQGICGGGEDGETIIETAKRESFEEAGIEYTSNYIQLDTITTMPVVAITGKFSWGEDVFVVKEYCFGVDATDQEIKLSDEHPEYRWLPYEEAKKLLKWDSDRTALWELNERLKRDQ
ncbi:MAG: NUDIX pyrophosphatase [Erysipelotrichaceae bacterium]|nr:NUDIX pyrophosphatase [Erysipelotrichaceae bacterium]